ncbi:MAG TPA: PASTA domain-containing protein [Solirubrobacterales bacterium]
MKRAGVVVTMLAAMALLTSAILGTGAATAAVKAPPRSVLVLKATWNAAGATPGSSNWIPLSSFSTASQQASDRLKEASHGFFGGWTTTIRGPLQIAAPRADSIEEETFQIGCGTQFFSDLSSRTDAAARAAGIDPDAHDLIIYSFDDLVCASMPDNVASAGLFDGRRIALQGETSAGGLLHMVGHYMGLGHAASIRCTSPTSGPVPLEFFKEGERCATNPNGDTYDPMGFGLDPESKPAGVFSAPAQNALGWFGTDTESRLFWELGRLEPPRVSTLEIAALSDPFNRTHDQRAIRFEDANSVYWVEYRANVGADTGLRATPGLVVHRELFNRTAAGAPVTQLLDMNPSTPISDAGLPVGQSWSHPAGKIEITFVGVSEDGTQAKVKIGPKPAPIAPLPHPIPPQGQLPNPDRSMLVINVGWNAPNAADAAPLNLSYLDKTAAMINSTMNFFYRRSALSGFYQDRTAYVAGSSTIPAPRLGSGKPLSTCTDRKSQDAEEFKDYIYEQGEEVAENAGFEPSRFGHLVVVYSRSFCGFGGLQRDSTGDIQIARRDPGVVYHEFGHYLGLNHAEALHCHAGVGVAVTLSHSCARVEYGDPIDPMGASSLPGTFGPINAKVLGWMDDQFYNVNDGFETVTRTIKPFGETALDGRKRAIRLVDGETTLWLDYRAQVGPDRFEVPPFPEDWGFNPEAEESGAESLSGIPTGLYIHREVHDGGFDGDEDGAVSQLIDMTPQNGFGDSDLDVGRTWANPIGVMQITLNSAGPGGASITISRKPRPVAVPNLEGATEAEAKAKLESLGLVYGGVTDYIDDCLGTNIGKVMKTLPSAGTNVALGAAVTVKIGQKPRQMGNCQ